MLNAAFVFGSLLIVVSVLIRVSQTRRLDRRSGWLLAAGASWLFGNGWWYYYQEIAASQPSPSLSDAGYLLALGCLGGLVTTYLPSTRHPADLRRVIVDGLLISAGIFVLGWLFYLERTIQQAQGLSTSALAVSLAYPTADVALLTLVIVAMRHGLAGDRSVRVLALGLGSYALADFGWHYAAVHGGYDPGSAPFDAAWLAGYGLLALMPWMPSAGQRADGSLSGRHFAWSFPPLVLAWGAALALVVFDENGLSSADVPLLVVTTSLTLLRQLMLTRDFRSLTRSLGHQVEERTAELVDSHAEMRHLAMHDSLTGLANRRQLMEALDQTASPASQPSDGAALVLLDLDDFKNVNDTLGHSCGDELLIVVGRRLQTVTRAHDLVARLGGDEFAILLRGVDLATAETTVERMIVDLREPVVIGSSPPIASRSSAGVAMLDHEVGPVEMMMRADVAMYAAKRNGKNVYAVYNAEAHSAVAEFQQLENDLRNAAANHELVVHFQPVVAAGTEQLTGCEALVRWQHPTRGLLQPADFMAAAERTGAIRDIGLCVLEEACAQAVDWSTRYPAVPLIMSVNVSAVQLRCPSFVGDVADVLARTGLSGERLVLELTETSVQDLDSAEKTLLDIRDLGVRIALDDFGIGYSSLGYLRTLPIDLLKIDRSFVRQLDSGHGRAFLHTIVELAQAVGMRVCAEGVEETKQADIVYRLGVDEWQGFLFGRPVPASDFEKAHLRRLSLAS